MNYRAAFLCVAVLLALSTSAMAEKQWQFVNLWDTTMTDPGVAATPFENFESGILNDNNLVVFDAFVDEDPFIDGIYSIDLQGNLSKIFEESDDLGGGVMATGFISRRMAVNNAGMVVVNANLSSGGDAILKGGPGMAPSILVDNSTTANPGGRTTENIFEIDLNNNGTVVFDTLLTDVGPSESQKDRGIVKGTTAPFNVVFDNDQTFGGGEFRNFDDPVINDNGLMVFQANLDDGNAGIFSHDGSSLTLIADESTDGGRFSGTFDTPSVNNHGDILFEAELTAGGRGLFHYDPDTGVITELFSTNDPTYTNVGDSTINDDGKWVSQVGLGEDAGGILVGDLEGNLEVILETSNMIFGGELEFLKSGHYGQLNASGNVSFSYQLTNGQQGVAIAMWVPEPASAAILGGLGVLIAMNRRGNPVKSRKAT